MADNSDLNEANRSTELDDRRAFLARCGKFAAVTPPAIAFLLSTSLNSKAIAHSGGHEHNYR